MVIVVSPVVNIYSTILRIQMRNSRLTWDKVRRHGVAFYGCKTSMIHIVLGLYFIIKRNDKMRTNHAHLIAISETYPDAAN